jgi:hypothetical protein
MKIANLRGATPCEVTESLSGYPTNLRRAYVGFKTFADAQVFADESERDVVLLRKRDGHSLYTVEDPLLTKPITPTDIVDRYGDDYFLADESDERHEVINALAHTPKGKHLMMYNTPSGATLWEYLDAETDSYRWDVYTYCLGVL